jgi:hypothetical protein
MSPNPRSSVLGRVGVGVAALVFVVSVAARVDAGAPSGFTITHRSIAQDRGPEPQRWQIWQIDYWLRWEGPTGIVLMPPEVSALVEGWVSNSRVPSHASPRWSSLTVSGTSGLAATTDLIPATDEAQRCRERAALHVWTDDGEPDNPAPVTCKPTEVPAVLRRPIVSLAPGATLRVRLVLEHRHFLYGPYDPLLGCRRLELRLGPCVLSDNLPIDREHHIVQPACIWPEPPLERRDPRQFVSAPDSLHLEAHIPGNQYYRFPDQPVRYATKMRLRFWYLIAPGTEGECKARIAQYKDTPSEWKVLSDGMHEELLSVIGRWVHVERTFRTEPEATTLALDFRIIGADVGEMWIDDVTLEPVGVGPESP